jgi:hypothetical protein
MARFLASKKWSLAEIVHLELFETLSKDLFAVLIALRVF